MDKATRLELMRIVWGPAPPVPSVRTVWEHGLSLLADTPDLVFRLVVDEGPIHTSLARLFGREGLAEFEAQVVEEFFCDRSSDGIREVVKYIMRTPPQVNTGFRQWLATAEWFQEQVSLFKGDA